MPIYRTLILALGFVISSTSYAAEFATYPGSACTPLLGSDYNAGGVALALQSDPEQLYNSSATSAIWVTCPLRKENVTDVSFMEVTARLVIRQVNTISGCRLRSHGPFGPIHQESQASVSVQGSHTLALAPVAGVPDGHYAMACLIPPAGSIYNYTAREFVP